MKEPGSLGDLLPECGVRLTLAELRAMAARQQRQIEGQAQLLAAKEQRLRFLQHQHHAQPPSAAQQQPPGAAQQPAQQQAQAAQHGRRAAAAAAASAGGGGGGAAAAAEAERLRRLRERVEAQEQKLRRLRALRGQVDQSKLSNASLTSDLDSIRALFNEKEKELSLAVAKVEELTRQLEELRRGRGAGGGAGGGGGGGAAGGGVAGAGGGTAGGGAHQPSPAALELDKLRRELMYRNKLNAEQSARVALQREALARRQGEMGAVDARIGELQARLQRKRLLNAQLAQHLQHHLQHQHQQQQHQQQQQQQHQQQQQPPLRSSGAKGKPRSAGNVAAVEPYHHAPPPPPPAQQQQQQPPAQQQPPPPAAAPSAPAPPAAPATAFAGARVSATDNSDLKRAVQGLTSMSQQQQQQALQGNMAPYKGQQGRGDTYGKVIGERILQDHKSSGLVHGGGAQDDFHAKPSGAPNSKVNLKDKEELFLPEFAGSKSDPKYQTLPYNTKFTVNYLATAQNKASQEKQREVSDDRRNEDNHKNVMNNINSLNNNLNNNNNNNNNNNTLQQQQQHLMTVHSIPIPSLSAANKGHATTVIQSQAETFPSNGLQFTHAGGRGAPPMQPNQQPVLGPRPFPGGFTATGLSRGQPIGGSSTTSSTSSLSTSSSSSASVSHQKPVSSVAPTSVQHQKPSPIYQTSSTKIQPVQPQTLSSTPQGILRDLRGELSPPQSTSTPVGTPDLPALPGSATPHDVPAGLGKPALPPKPAVPVKPTPPPRQSQHFTPTHSEGVPAHGRAGSGEAADLPDCAVNVGRTQPVRSATEHPISKLTQPPTPEDTGGGTVLGSTAPPPPPTSEPPQEEPPAPPVPSSTVSSQLQAQQLQRRTGGNSGESLPIIKARPLTIKKQPASEHPKLKSSASYGGSSSVSVGGPATGASSGSNGVHVSINRRIEMPPAFLFPETEAPPADLVSSSDSQSPSSIAALTTQSAAEGGQSDASPSNEAEEDGRLGGEGGDEGSRLQPQGASAQPGKGAPEGGKTDVSAAVVDVLNSINMNQQDVGGETGLQHIVRRAKKGNLKAGGSTKAGTGSRRVSFDPLALLLDASLEGELELVRKTAAQVANPSAANDEGITALHNAICAGHLDIVKFLVEFGCDVNAQDSDGWTPLHCAASCNNLAMVRFLVEHGACIFATTLSDHETAAEKCEEDEEGYDGCSEYLYSVQEKLGILNSGCVYAVYDYEAHNPDELSFREGDRMVVLRKGDEWEREWWWSRLNDQEGYAPRNLLGLYPRVQPGRKPE